MIFKNHQNITKNQKLFLDINCGVLEFF